MEAHDGARLGRSPCAGFLHLAVVAAAWSRKVVGWPMATHLRTELVLEALEMALFQRRARGSSITPTRRSRCFSRGV